MNSNSSQRLPKLLATDTELIETHHMGKRDGWSDFNWARDKRKEPVVVEDYPTVECPRCGLAQTDIDGFGFIACLPPGFRFGGYLQGHCGLCTHPSKSGSPNGMRCDLCGECDDRETAHHE